MDERQKGPASTDLAPEGRQGPQERVEGEHAGTKTEGERPDGAAPRGTSPVATAFAVLRCFTVDAPALGVVEIAEQVGMHKSSVSRLLAVLLSEGLVERDPLSQKYRLGLGLLDVAGPLLAHLDVRRAAAPALAELTRRTGETSCLMLWDGQAAVTIEQVPSPHPVKHAVELGTRYETVASSSVRIFLRRMNGPELSAQLRRLGASTADLTAASVHDDAETTVNDGLTLPDEVGVSAAVRDHRGAVIGSLLVAVPRYRVAPENLLALRTAVAAAASRVTARLGGATGEGGR